MKLRLKGAETYIEAYGPGSVSLTFVRSLRTGETDAWNSGHNTLPTLAVRLGRAEFFKNCRRGIYVFLDRIDAIGSREQSWRVVRIGTHSVKTGGSKSTLWGRLRQHKGSLRDGGGNHRGSIFRLLVGDALIEKEGLRDRFPHWGIKGSATQEIQQSELPLEQKVSSYIRQLPFLVIKVDPATDGPEHRAYLERNLIALLSSARNDRGTDWLGNYSTRTAVRESGLWNNNHVGEEYDPAFLDLLEYYVQDMRNGRT